MRDATRYADMARTGTAPRGQDVSKPVPGCYRFKLRSNGIVGAVRIWFGPPHDPVTGEEMDRSHRWQAEFLGEPVDFDDVWPGCAGQRIKSEEYRALTMRREWAAKNAPNSAFANPRRRYDPLSSNEPLPF